MTKWNRWIVALLLLLTAGCVSQTAVVSRGKKAYVAHGNMFKTRMYHCDATSGVPVCVAVYEVLTGE